MKLPAPLPLLAGAAGVGGWLVGRAARSQEAAAATDTTAPTPDATAGTPSSSSLDWGAQDLGGGSLPITGSGDPSGGGDTTGSGSGTGGISGPPLPLPGPTPTPTPTGPTPISRPPGTPPSGAVGWAVVAAGGSYWQAASSWNGSSYPVPLTTPQLTFPTTTARWVSGVKVGHRIGPNDNVSVRRLSHSGSSAGSWTASFVGSGIKVYAVQQAHT